MSIEAMKQALEALEQVTKELLAVRDELAERGARPTTNVFHQRLWDSSFDAYTNHAMPAAQALRTAIAKAEKQKPVALETVYETIIHWDEGGGKRSRRELARRIVDLYTTPPTQEFVCSTGLCHYKATSDERLMLEDAVLAEREACAKVCDQFIDEMQKVLPVEKLRETDPYKAFYKANAARIIQDTIRARGNT